MVMQMLLMPACVRAYAINVNRAQTDRQWVNRLKPSCTDNAINLFWVYTWLS